MAASQHDDGPESVRACPLCRTALDMAASSELIPQLVCRTCGLSAGDSTALVLGRASRSA